MLKKFLMPLMLSASLALLLAGCGGSDNTSTNTTTNTTGDSKTPTTSTPTVNPTPTTTTPTTPVSGEKIGVPDCDEFIAKYEACISDKIPASARAQFEGSLTTWRNAWRAAASTAQGKAGLAVVCKAALDQTKISMQSYGCNF